jgi:hypothetical protein
VDNTNNNVTDATSGIATSTTFGSPVVNHNYFYNGTTWDQAQDDASKNLKVGVYTVPSGAVASGAYAAGSLASGAAVDGWDLSVQSTTAAAGCGSGTGVNPCLKQIDADIKSSIPAGTAAIGTLTPATPVSCTALCANLVVKASAGTLYSFEIAADSTLSGAAWWEMVYNATSAPADGAGQTPLKCYAAPSGTTTFNGSFTSGGIAASTGITIGVSTTGCFTKTASTHAMISGDFQ